MGVSIDNRLGFVIPDLKALFFFLFFLFFLRKNNSNKNLSMGVSINNRAGFVIPDLKAPSPPPPPPFFFLSFFSFFPSSSFFFLFLFFFNVGKGFSIFAAELHATLMEFNYICNIQPAIFSILNCVDSKSVRIAKLG